ncbi:MAG: hypothetical protein ACR2FE_06025 [Aeromicrobium sp.]
MEFIEVAVASLGAHFSHGDFIATSASDCPGGDPEDPGDDRKVNICRFTGSESNPVEFIEISVNALPAHVQHGDFIADSEGDCDEGDPGPEDDKVSICHFTSSVKNPVVFITISVNALQMHIQQHGDFIADSPDDCQRDDDDDDDDSDDDDDDSDGRDGSGKVQSAALLPDTGGPSLWTLLMGCLLTVLGMTVLSNRESMGRVGLFGPVPADGPSVAWSHTIGRSVDMAVPVTATATSDHRGRWTVFGVLAVVVAVLLGRRATR